jgi:hypothetical protein
MPFSGIANGISIQMNPTEKWTNSFGSTISQQPQYTNVAAAVFTSVTNSTAGGADSGVHLNFSVVNGSPTSVDLTNLADWIGNAVDFARVKVLMVEHLPTSLATAGVVVGNAGSNPFTGWLGGTTPTITLLPGEFFVVGGATAAGQVVSGTHKILLLTNSDATHTTALVRVTAFGGSS